MKKLIVIMIVLFTELSFGQIQIKKSAISSDGGSITVGNSVLLYTVGELAVQENTQANTQLSEGFIGPDISAILGINDFSVLQGLSLFPNPVTTNLTIQMIQPGNYEIYLFDLTGKQLIAQKITNDNQLVLNLSNFETAVYLLYVVNREKQISKQVKIIKN